MVEIKADASSNRFVTDVFNDRQMRRKDLVQRPWHVGTAAVDTTVTSLAWLATAGQLDIDSIVPDSAERYHRSRSTFDAISSVPMMFVGVGLGNKAVRVGGALEKFADARGMNSTARNLLFADTLKVAKYDDMMSTARSAKATGIANTTAMTTPNLTLSGTLDEGAAGLRALTGAGTYEDAASWATKATTRNALKQGVAQEVAIFGMLNQSEFLFPAEMGVQSFLGFGALGVGLNVGVDVAVRRAAVRKSLANAATQGSAVAKYGRKADGVLTEGSAVVGVAGERWQQVMAGLYGAERAAALEFTADAISQGGGGALSKREVYEAMNEFKSSAATNIRQNIGMMFKDRMPSLTLRKGHGSLPAISQTMPAPASSVQALADRVGENNGLGVAMAEVGGDNYAYRIHEHQRQIGLKLNEAQAKFDKLDMNATPGDLRKAQDEIDNYKSSLSDVNSVYGGIVEQTSVLNGNPYRRIPYSERAGSTSVDYQNNGASHVAGRIRLDHDGSLKTLDKRKELPTKLSDLSYDEMTELNTLVGKVTGSQKWSDKFWGNFLQDPNMTLESLPPQILDALRDGLLKFPEGPILPPKAGQIKNIIQSGRINNIALANKFDWWKANKGDQALGQAPLDLMDAEKALNLRLVDKDGFPNALGHALNSFTTAKSSASARAILLQGADSHTGLDALFELGAGEAQATTKILRDALDSQWEAALKGVDGLNAHKKPGGIGALYHKIDVPTDGERQVAKIAAARNAMRSEELLFGDSAFVNSISQAMMRDQIANAGARDTLALFHDLKVKTNSLTTTTFAHRFQLSLQHAHQVSKDAYTAANTQIDAMLTPIGDNFRKLQGRPSWAQTAPQMAGAQGLIHRGFSLQADGWAAGYNKIDITRPGAQRTLEELGPLRGAPARDEDWVMFDLAMAANDGVYIPVSLGDEAAEALADASRVSYEHLASMNVLRSAAGMHPLEKLKGHLPQANFNRFKLRYIEDPDTGKVIGYAKGRTDKEADAALVQAIDGMNARRTGTPVQQVTVDDIKLHYDAIDEVFLHNLRDFSGIKQTGTSGGKNADYRLDVSADLLGDMMVAMRNTSEDLTRRTIAANFAEPISEARMMLSRIGAGPDQGRFYNAVQQWENVLLGSDRLAEDSFAKRGHSWAEDFANAAMGRFADATPAIWRIAGYDLEGQATKQQAKFAKEVLDAHQPFSTIMQPENLNLYLKAGESIDPYRAAKALQMANRATTFVALKLANVAHPILNYTGAAVTQPGVLAGMQKNAKETVEQWQVRVGPVADYLDAEGTATINSAKLMTEGFELMFKDPAAVAYARKRGFIDANMLEELNKVTSFKPSGFVDAMEKIGYHGDFINRWLTPLQEKITGKAASAQTLSERSETGTRAWIHMTGYALAKRSGKDLNEDQMHSFAHYFANQNIADFSPNIRGEAFRGIAGIPFGLFQSYSINLYQRMFRYIEDGNKRALAIQMATQASMFGVQGMPGWNALNAMYFNTKDSKANADGATTLNERIYTSLGKTQADILMGGALSNLPRLAGAEGAVNLYSSGDANPRAPNSPAISVGTQVAQGISEGIRVAREEVPKLFTAENFDSRRFAEVLANYAPSRGYRSLTDIALGDRTDRRGNLVADDTRSGLQLISRLLGTRTRDEMMTSSAIWENGQAQRQRIDDMSRVRAQMLRQVRDGSVTEDQMAYFLADYMTAGGDQDQWSRWLKFTTEKATQTRDERALDRIVNKAGEILPHNFASYNRLEAAGTEPTQEMLDRVEPNAGLGVIN